MPSRLPAPLPTHRASRPGAGLRPAAGKILVGLSAGLLALSAAAALALPPLQHARLAARAGETATELKQFADAFRRFAHDRRDWPAATPEPGVLPAGMAAYLPAERWLRPTPLGGRYTWARETLQRGERYQAAIVIADAPNGRVASDRRLLAAVDLAVDDGNLDTGRFRLGFRFQPVFVLEH